MLPVVFGENLFDDMFDDAFDLMPSFGRRNPLYGKHAHNLMKTDVRETDQAYELDIDLPGFKKEDVQAKLENGYLTVSASKGLNRDEKDKKGRYIRRERYAWQCSRSFYVGDDVEPEQVSAKFEDGILKLTVPKKAEEKLPEQSSIQID